MISILLSYGLELSKLRELVAIPTLTSGRRFLPHWPIRQDQQQSLNMVLILNEIGDPQNVVNLTLLKCSAVHHTTCYM